MCLIAQLRGHVHAYYFWWVCRIWLFGPFNWINWTVKHFKTSLATTDHMYRCLSKTWVDNNEKTNLKIQRNIQEEGYYSETTYTNSISMHERDCSDGSNNNTTNIHLTVNGISRHNKQKHYTHTEWSVCNKQQQRKHKRTMRIEQTTVRARIINGKRTIRYTVQ